MEISSIWNNKCYKDISWAEIENKESPHYIHYLGDTALVMKKKKETKRNEAAIIGAIEVAGVTLGIISPYFTIASVAFCAGKKYYEYSNEYEKRCIENIYSEIFPFKEIGYIGVGRRERRMGSANNINIFDIDAVRDIVEGLAHGISSVANDVMKVEEKYMDLKNNLYIVGGPISNAYSRKVLYGNYLQIPYKFRLDLTEELANSSPLELKALIYDIEPNWYICDENGVEIEGGTPKIENGILTEDSFMIIKCRNIRANNNTRSVIFAGCHGPGTSAAGKLVKDKKIIEYIYSKTKGQDFQLIGKVPVEYTLIEAGSCYKPGEITVDNIIKIHLL